AARVFRLGVIDSVAARIGVLDENDRFIAVNRAWKERTIAQGMPRGYPPVLKHNPWRLSLGRAFLIPCRQVAHPT
ncbi:MAG: hypothetical protein JWR59_2001, partial [Brevundimonas sp.]|nr:hypothetical protein [Brevundimonas sp.]